MKIELSQRDKYILFALITIMGIGGSYLITFGNQIPAINHVFIGFSLLNANPEYINGHLWRINETNYVIWTKGITISVETNYPTWNYNTCYGIALNITQNPYFISYNATILLHLDENDCKRLA